MVGPPAVAGVTQFLQQIARDPVEEITMGGAKVFTPRPDFALAIMPLGHLHARGRSTARAFDILELVLLHDGLDQIDIGIQTAKIENRFEGASRGSGEVFIAHFKITILESACLTSSQNLPFPELGIVVE